MASDEVQQLVATSSGTAPPLHASENSAALAACSPVHSGVTPLGTGQHAFYGPQLTTRDETAGVPCVRASLSTCGSCLKWPGLESLPDT
jgi:hypothetical protein